MFDNTLWAKHMQSIDWSKRGGKYILDGSN